MAGRWLCLGTLGRRSLCQSSAICFVDELKEERWLQEFPAVRARALAWSHQYTTLWKTAQIPLPPSPFSTGYKIFSHISIYHFWLSPLLPWASYFSPHILSSALLLMAWFMSGTQALTCLSHSASYAVRCLRANSEAGWHSFAVSLSPCLPEGFEKQLSRVCLLELCAEAGEFQPSWIILSVETLINRIFLDTSGGWGIWLGNKHNMKWEITCWFSLLGNACKRNEPLSKIASFASCKGNTGMPRC